MFIYPEIPRGGISGAGPAAQPCHQGLCFLSLTSAIHSLHLSKPSAVAPGARGALEAGEGQSEQALLSWLSLSPGHQTFLRKSS